MVSHEDVRRERIAMIKRTYDKTKKEINVEKLIAQCSLEWGASRRTILEYIKVVNNL